MATVNTKTVTANIRLEAGLLAAIDYEAEKDRRSRNSLVVQILEQWILGLPVTAPMEEDRSWAREKVGKLIGVNPVVQKEVEPVGRMKLDAVGTTGAKVTFEESVVGKQKTATAGAVEDLGESRSREKHPAKCGCNECMFETKYGRKR